VTETTTAAGALPAQIAFEAPDDVLQSLSALGRTEDVRFSPSGDRLAFACYARSRVAIADVEIHDGGVVVSRLTEHVSPHLEEPHGLDFADDDTLLVADRAGGLATFRLPPRGADDELTLVGVLDDDPELDGSGSLAVRSAGSSRREVLVCNNWADSITRHALDERSVAVVGAVAIRKWLDLPDGLTVSGDGRWLAVSNHNSHTVLIYEDAHVHESADPVGLLRGARYPHGLRFGRDDRELLVADAALPYVHVFPAVSGGWRGARYPSAAIRVMDDATFVRGRNNPQEGGPKGIDVHPQANVLAVTAECVPLAFFDLSSALDGAQPAEEAGLGYELLVLEEAEQEKARLREDAASAKARLAEVQRTKTWRLMQRPRHVYGAVRGLRPRRGP
jgi:hypothetical protein